MRRSSAIILLGLALGTQAAKGGDADELKALGFSPDGRYFAFEQHGATEGAAYSVTTVIEVTTGRPVKGSRTSYGDEERKRLAKTRAATAKQIKRLKITPKGFMTVSVRGIDIEPFEEALVKSFALPGSWFGPETWLVLRQFKLVAQRCKDTNGSPVGFALALERKDSPTIQLSHETAIPASRGCPTRYRVAEAHTRRLSDGAAALAVIVQEFTPDVGGQNRGFMAVTSRIPPSNTVRPQ
jgi:predicted secreted protein